MSKRIAVTGAAGRLGQFMIQELLNEGYTVRALTLHDWEDSPVEDQRTGSILDFDWLQANLDGCDAVIHLAAIPSPRKDQDSLVMETNMVGTYNVLLAAGQLGIQKVAAASTDCTFGFTFSKHPPQPVYLPVDEEHPDRPDDSYGLSKILAERVADGIVQRFPGMYVASLRITMVTGPDDYVEGSDFRRGMSDPDHGPENLWSYIDGRDASRAFRLAVEADRTGHEVFCIASKRTRSSWPSRELIARYYPEAELRWDFQGNESLENSSKAKRILGFEAEF